MTIGSKIKLATGRFRRRSKPDVSGIGDDGDNVNETQGYTPPESGPLQSINQRRPAANELPVSDIEAIGAGDCSNHSQPQRPLQHTNNNHDHCNNQTISIDDLDVGLNNLISPSSNNAVMALECSSSDGDSVTNKLNVAAASPSSYHSNQIPTLPTHQRPRSGSSIALETHKDKVDDEAYSAWWFLTSISESYDTRDNYSTQPKNTKSSPRQELPNQGSGSSGGIVAQLQKEGEVEAKPCKSPDSDASKHSSKFGMLELPSWVNKSKSSETNRRYDDMSQQQQQQQQQTNKKSSQPKSIVQNKQIVGGEYTTKEQIIRNEWIAKNDALGGKYDTETGTPDEDSQSTAPYHYIPPKLEPAIVPATPQSTNTSDWDFNMIPNRARSWRSRSTSEGQIEWTPQDSSYGAAVPAFGCIPKRIRKLLEGVFVVIILALLIFIVVKVGIMLKISSSSEGKDISFDDDDHYEAFSESNDNHSESNDNGSNNESNDHDADRI